MNKLTQFDAWSANGGFSAPRSAQGYLRGGMSGMVAASACGASDDKPKASACGASDDKPKASACGAGDDK